MLKPTFEIGPDLIRRQLHLLLDYKELKNAPTLAKFLEFIVEEKLAGREDEIKEYTIGVKALQKPGDFNPQLDAVVRIHAGRLRRVLFQYYHNGDTLDQLIISIPKGTYIPNFELPIQRVE